MSENPLPEYLLASAELARSSHVSGRLVDEALRIAGLEIAENPTCPVPNSLAQLLEQSAKRGVFGWLAQHNLSEILNARDAHFKNQSYFNQ